MARVLRPMLVGGWHRTEHGRPVYWVRYLTADAQRDAFLDRLVMRPQELVNMNGGKTA